METYHRRTAGILPSGIQLGFFFSERHLFCVLIIIIIIIIIIIHEFHRDASLETKLQSRYVM